MLHHISKGQGRLAVMVHGATLDHRSMMETFEPIFETVPGWRRVYVDLPGHGRSSAPPEMSTQTEMLNAVIETVTAVCPGERMVLIGMSRGSYIARGFAHLRPDLVDGLLLLVPGGNPGTEARLPPHVTLVSDPDLSANATPTNAQRLGRLVVQRADLLEKARRLYDPAKALHDPDLSARILENFEFDFDVMVPETPIEGPCLIVAGRQDSASGYLDAIDLMAIYRRASLAILDAAGHNAAWERPEVFEALTRDWLQRLSD